MEAALARKAYYESRKARGLCQRCPSPVANGLVHCAVHASRQKNRDRSVYFSKLRQDVLAAYGGPVCKCCGERSIPFLTLDHVDGNGQAHRKEIGKTSGTGFYERLRSLGFPQLPRLQVLCFNCNLGRQVNGGVCPHQQERVLPSKLP